MTTKKREGDKVIGTFIDAIDWNQTIKTIMGWGKLREHRTVCLCNVHSSVTATTDKNLANALSCSDMVLPDGSPIAWVLRRKGYKNQHRIAGPDLMINLCKKLQNSGISVYLFGSTDRTLNKLTSNLKSQFPALKIAGNLNPKYGKWTNEEELKYINKINASGAGVIFIGLGCPKQEIWMVKNKGNVNGVMLGVGAAFDFHAGVIKRAPEIYQTLGLEWLHRLLSEPRRLWKRYLTTNTKFIYLTALDLFSKKIKNIQL